jgi:beta-N-acetylhexosaminidase
MMNQIGQLFITGFEGRTPPDDFLEFFCRENIGGLLLFEENCNPHSQAEEIIREIAGRATTTPFFAVDQEGGRVCRFRGAPVEFASAEEFGRTKNVAGYEEAITRAAYYLQSLGVNLILGPVADLNLNDRNACLKGRTFGSSPAAVMAFIETAIRSCHRAGLLTCVKHFPGLGAATVDPHQAVATADYDMQSFLNRESLTFKAGIDAGTDMIMTTHLVVPEFDKKLATESEILLNMLLREKLEYDGIVITDDLLMKGSSPLGSHGERAFRAFMAGHDILLFGKNYLAAREALDYFKKAYNDGLISDERLEITLDRINGLKSKITTSAML